MSKSLNNDGPELFRHVGHGEFEPVPQPPIASTDKSNLTQEEAYNIVQALEDRAAELLDSARKIVRQYNIPATLVTIRKPEDAPVQAPVKVYRGKMIYGF